MSDASPPDLPGVVRVGEWQDWQRSRQVGRWARAALKQALECSLVQWRDERARFEADAQAARSRLETELAQLRQRTVDQAHAEAQRTWGEHLAAWRQERRSELLSLRDDVAALVSEVMKALLQDLPMEARLALVLRQLDPLIEQRHGVQLHVAPSEMTAAQQALQTCWSEAAWCDAAPRMVADPSVTPGQLKAVTVAGVLVLDWAQQLAHFQRQILGVEPGAQA